GEPPLVFAVDSSLVTEKNELATMHNERKQATEKGDPVSRANNTHAPRRSGAQPYEPQPYEEADEGPNLVEIHVSETFSGDIEGEGVVRFLQAVRTDESASSVGMERVTGSIDSRQGSFLLQD